MNNFTKEELENILSDIDSLENMIPGKCGNDLRNKIIDLIDNYCEHEHTWTEVKDEIHPHYIELKYNIDEFGEYPALASVKKYGCINLWECGGHSFPIVDRDSESVDYRHICEIDEEIRMLEALRDAAKQHFGDEWPS